MRTRGALTQVAMDATGGPAVPRTVVEQMPDGAEAIVIDNVDSGKVVDGAAVKILGKEGMDVLHGPEVIPTKTKKQDGKCTILVIVKAIATKPTFAANKIMAAGAGRRSQGCGGASSSGASM